MAMEYYEAVGRRKEATARVRLFPGGDGSIVVNERPLSEYFVQGMKVLHLTEPLKVTGLESHFNISVRVKGGGINGQAGAVRLGIARALLKTDPELRPVLRKGGFLTRDARIKERKKPGLKRARKAPQYTKR
ncbi:MAG: 30S ribosomal protein S9 [Chloroflexi bacterium]|nr:MAG: 30S ribosomal protein S9 [Anaerolineaceae bacterium 4572_32.2]RLC81512.1 MAG: 30S ribosomal protein S9 [Chloroflexota bacterium]RLC88592.1 MAG: 30S ribosomal protein S9 [Chloroflexota bacterium]HEY74037.1 30S ribosomal protein S9 [Thermoflexia bacterium]